MEVLMATAAETSSHTGLLALREWKLNVDAIAAGEQSLLIRKGGISEGSDGFSVEGYRFALLPTLFHQKHGTPQSEPYEVTVVCDLLGAVEAPSESDLSPLAPYHRYDAEQLATRVKYKPERPLTLMAVRAYRLAEPRLFPVDTVQAVCRSWLSLPIDPDSLTTDRIAVVAPVSLLSALNELKESFRVV
jgi:hypothetical protein